MGFSTQFSFDYIIVSPSPSSELWDWSNSNLTPPGEEARFAQECPQDSWKKIPMMKAGDADWHEIYLITPNSLWPSGGISFKIWLLLTLVHAHFYMIAYFVAIILLDGLQGVAIIETPPCDQTPIVFVDHKFLKFNPGKKFTRHT